MENAPQKRSFAQVSSSEETTPVKKQKIRRIDEDMNLKAEEEEQQYFMQVCGPTIFFCNFYTFI